MTINLNSENCQEATNELFEQMAAGIRVRRKISDYGNHKKILVQTHDGDGWCNSMDVNEKDQARMIKQGLSPENDSDVLKYYNQNKITIR